MEENLNSFYLQKEKQRVFFNLIQPIIVDQGGLFLSVLT